LKLRTTAALLACAALLAACGGDDDDTTTESAAESTAPATIAEIEVDAGPFETEEDFVAAVNDYCGQTGEIYGRAPVYGISAPGLEAEFTRLVDLDNQDVEQTEAIEAPEELADEWADYNTASAELTAAHEDVLAAAADGNADKANQILFGPSTEAGEDLSAASEALGVECTSDDQPLSEAEPGAATDAAADAPQPTNTIDEAADEWLAAFQSGDCEEIADIVHTQVYADPKAIADPDGTCQTRADGTAEWEIAGTSQWGPVGVAAMQTAPGQFSYERFVIDPDKGDELRQVGEVYGDVNLLDPAPEGNDADAQLDAALEAIRADDVDAFNEAISVESVPGGETTFFQEGETIDELGNDPNYAESVVTDITEDTEATPVLLGSNQLEAVYLLETEGENDYLLVMQHQPGSETEYRLDAYWALPGEAATTDTADSES
jgi:hypothetical protein